MAKKRKSQRDIFWEKRFIIYLGIFLLLSAGTALFQARKTFAGNFADNILRPVIGNSATIGLEAAVFGIEDHVHTLSAAFIKPNPHIFTTAKAEENDTPIASPSSIFEPLDVSPLTNFPILPGEGMWTSVPNGSEAAVMMQTFVRPDPERSFALVALVEMNMKKLSLFPVAGLYQPGGPTHPGPGKIPAAAAQSNLLVAAFNGGFQQKDGYFGMIVGSNTYLPLQKGLATLVVSKDAPPSIVSYAGQVFGSDIIGIRQNGPLLLDNGRIVTSSNAWNMQTWGLTTTDSMYTWRSGLGVTKDGNLIYAAGPSLVPETLARALQSAGAVSAMQLDINSTWDRFIVYSSIGNGQYTYYPLMNDMVNGGYEYLNGYQKDFFYVLKK